ncbi:hypothetical protein [Mesorhizobium sp. M00.F.Ca.ET.216.01.1.1]|uniref:hypothetical protein n=1 Tax=Mesorhizobium sp. M00.F.Ca.ET.216.01.1.1 TaxID=2500528 RepID=UPI000FDBA9A8|nr:hypothetical protein [Mesorhizobium sp. M00.F.Ca.ET.216.01.1.1]TGQ32786.1 hypothetical protein EN859_027985 [Mesorhizobium sp. M00.F.Ca.ET.216.01.1.1]
MGKTKRKPDAKLLRLEAELNAASDRWNEATARTAQIEEELDRLRSRREKAEKKEAKKAAAFVRARDRVMQTQAKSLEGLAVRVRGFASAITRTPRIWRSPSSKASSPTSRRLWEARHEGRAGATYERQCRRLSGARRAP